MTIKDQLNKIKDNWILIAAVLAVLVFLNFGNLGSTFTRQMSFGSAAMESSNMGVTNSYSGNNYGIIPVHSYGDFTPDIQDRKITKSSSISIETETGAFKEAESRLKSAIKLSGAYLLNENVNRYDSGWKSYYSGTYQIKVDSKKYNDVVAQFKGIGEVKSFNENAEDITASFKNLQIEIDSEKQKLERYNKIYGETTLIADKIQLSDKIFEQERTIKYLEDSLKNEGQRVDYSTIYITLNEKQSGYANITFIKFSELISRLVASINSLLNLIFAVLPYAVAALIIWIAIKFFRKRF